MASHVVVIDSSLRRATIKTTPTKPLSEVLEEACTKLNLSPTQYGLKHSNKQVDLSRTIRLAGLSSGAKLELVQLSKSAGVVSIALQVPDSEATGIPNGRLTDKFPSDTTLWKVLRKFEEGGGSRNFTARGIPSTTQSGAGRLYYEQPVVQVMNRELSSLTDLQKTLAQLGFNSGSALLRLSFRATETPLEEAMLQIRGYFESVEGPPSETNPDTTPVRDESSVAVNQPIFTPEPESSIAHAQSHQETQPAAPSQPQPEQITNTTSRPVSVFRPPSSSTPAAARQLHNDSDYTPTVEHAHVHQKLLQQNSRNTRLLTDAQLAAQEQEEAAKWAAVKDVEIKIRFPDQSAASTKFGQLDTAADLYKFVRECLAARWRSEPFILRNPGIRGKNELIPDDSSKKLISDLLLRGRVLVNFGWDDNKASVEARSTKSVLREELQSQAQELRVLDIPGVVDDDRDPGTKVNVGKKDTKSEEGGGSKAKMPKWLKGLSKK
ncbi:uncharacterized protein PV06_06171 [Exophiala oligosperma]|uniref:TUG ubiquitin-like domain-containing protein n=1 Tax=Exophiala oligosperma TaxID=215243 RepID=A0A0D2BYU7_9EURO|nr:uncharacterized protein PV06_06171 [Exophiala oligosperma]KIW42642.1 hypothetical protein PV06_06171 [Exophiala oligosperma]